MFSTWLQLGTSFFLFINSECHRFKTAFPQRTLQYKCMREQDKLASAVPRNTVATLFTCIFYLQGDGTVLSTTPPG